MLALVTLMTVVSALYVWPGWPKRYLPDFIDYPQGPIIDLGRDAMRLGLDLQGGTYVLTQADTSALPPGADVDAAMEGVEDVIERRVNATGVAETEVTREGKDRLAVQLPGISPDEAAELIGKTALLEFRTPVRDDSGQIVCMAPDGDEFSVPVEYAIEGVNPTTGEKEGQCTSGGPGSSVVGLIEWEPATALDSSGTPRVLTGSFVTPGGAEVIAAVQGCIPACVTLEFTGEGGLLFQQITEDVVGYPLAIFLDEELISAPNVNQPITGGNAVIEGLEVDEAETLAIQINAGSLPVPLETIQQKEIEATLGEETLVKGVQAGIIGVLAVMFFMIVYYRLPGILASLALVTYISVVMLVFKLDDPIIGSVTMTLPGIAGFVLSIGMAVDGNILVFERMKEELRAGRTLGPAIEHGFSRAWSSIRDSNVSTLITCAILWWFGDQFGADPVRSFAITLAIGVVFSMFSAIVVTRTLLRTVVATPLAKRLDLFVPRGAREPEVSEERKPFVFDFVKRRGLYFAISAVVLIPGVISLLIPPSLEPGIDFTSGATFTIRFEDSIVSADDVQDAFSSAGHDEARVQKTSDDEFIVRTAELEGPTGPPVGPAPPSERDEIEEALAEQLGPFTITNFNQVSEIVSQEIVAQAAVALAFAGLAILVYLMWSFRNIPKSYRYGIAAVIAAAHDALIILGAFSIFGKLFGTEINREFIAALLTVIGFSVHDTIVVFDRLREKITANPDVPFDELANASLSETMARSINTSTTVLFTVVALLVLGTGSIDVLLIAFLIGVVAGTYSSIFIATQIVVAWEDGDFSRLWRRIVPHRQPRMPAPEPS